MANVTARESFFKGKGLHKTGRFALKDAASDRVYGCTDNPNDAFAWMKAAKIHAMHVEVLDNGIS